MAKETIKHDGIFRSFRTVEDVEQDTLRELHEAGDCNWCTCSFCIEEEAERE